MAHTPGPWTVGGTTYEDDEIGISVREGASSYLVGVAYEGNGDDANGIANARLLAAAPALLEAVQLAEATIERLNRHNSADGTLHVLRLAIQSATKT